MSLPKRKLHINSIKEGEIYSEIQENLKEPISIVVNDEAIIRQTIKNQPEKGFEMIYKRYYRQLCSHSLRFVYSTEIAEDIVSDVFLMFWRNELFKTVKSTYRAYLYTAVRNRSLNYVKAEFGTKGIKEKEEILIEKHGDINDPQSILLMNELMNKITQSINNFSPQCQRVFLLSRIEGKKNREIADKLEINIKTVEAHLVKALTSIRKTLSDYV